MSELDTAVVRLETDVDKRDPQQWGKLVLSRAQQGGDVLDIDPETYWDGLYYWFRSRGLDPHPWRRRCLPRAGMAVLHPIPQEIYSGPPHSPKRCRSSAPTHSPRWSP